MMNPDGGLADASDDEPIRVSPSFASKLARVRSAAGRVADARESDDREAVRTALRSLEDVLARVDGTSLQGESRAVWRELAMRLRNDAVDGRWAASGDRLDGAVDQLMVDLGVLRDRFGLSEDADTLIAGGTFAAPEAFR